MPDEVKKVIIQIKAPKGDYGGEVAEGHYCVVDGYVVLTDESGKPIAGVDKRYVGLDGDARLIACRMVRANRRGGTRVAGFHRRINYPKLVY